MAKSNEPKNNDTDNNKDVIWGTLEELLLACAVNRYGTNCWDSVAREIQKRSTTFHFLSPLGCQQKYHDLRRRFIGGPNYVANEGDVELAGNDATAWLDELRRLRIDELKRELEHYDISIVSLQSKVNKLKEEREQNLTEDVRQRGQQEAKSDLRNSQDRELYKEDDHKSPLFELIKSSPAENSVKFSGDDSDRENISVNESNSTDSKAEKDELEKRVEQGARLRGEAVEPATDGRPDPVDETKNPVGEDSFNGSTDTPAKATKAGIDSDKDEEARERGDSDELIESVAESKDLGVGGTQEEGANKENSDVQSSANLTRKKGNDGGRVGVVSSAGEEPEDRNQSKLKTIKRSAEDKLEPLIDFLEVIRCRKLGSVFERRQQSQETCRYKNLIRQDIDLENIKVALEQGLYVDCTTKFYRDLLLLATNYIVFFGKKSSEYQAANALRQLIVKEIPQDASEHSRINLSTAAGKSSLLKTKYKEGSREASPATIVDSLLLKPKLSGPVIVCRKRSSITAKSMVSSAGGERRRDPGVLSCNDEKKKPGAATVREKSPTFGAVAVREKSPTFGAATTKSPRDQMNDKRGNSNKNKSRSNSYDNQHRPCPTLGASLGHKNDSYEASRSDKKSNNISTNKSTWNGSRKKGSAASFLSRIKCASPPESEKTLLQTLKDSGRKAETTSTGKGADQKKIAMSSDRVRDDHNSHTNSKGKMQQQKENETRDDTTERKDSGRPPKRVAAMTATGKRRRNSVAETEATSKKRAKK